ncbi:hypothetical protein MMC24_007275 [Lignoscripta atroalba]|nr:hypothetical protein [Lignoscripta atroalba]
MALPLRLLWGLQITTRQKLALAGIFSLGLVIIVFAIVRVIETSASTHHVDPIWLALWSMVEASVDKLISPSAASAIIVSNLPSFRVLLTTRSISAYKKTPSSSNSRLSRSNKGAIRLGPLHTNDTTDPPSTPVPAPTHNTSQTPPKGQYYHHMNLSAALGDPNKSRPTGHFAAAESLAPTGGSGNGSGGGRPRGESEEDILPKDTVHVRSDFVSSKLYS